jgi:hypothetical protein
MREATTASNRSRNQQTKSRLKGPLRRLRLMSRRKRTPLQSLIQAATARNKNNNQATTSRHQTKTMSPPRKRDRTTFKHQASNPGAVPNRHLLRKRILYQEKENQARRSAILAKWHARRKTALPSAEFATKLCMTCAL